MNKLEENIEIKLSVREGYWYTVGPKSINAVLYQRIVKQYDIHRRKTITKKEALHQWYRPGSQETTCY